MFLATFFNTAILILLTNANTQQTVLSFLPFNGIYSDLDQSWYLNVGPTLIYTMQINSVYVYIDWIVYLITNWIYRSLDGGIFCCCRKSTKCVTQQQYITLYSGPEHLMFYKYSTILNTVFVTFMYGLALPILFPIAAFTFLNLYIVERILITYYHPKPPMYDDRLNKAAIQLLRWAPVFMLFFGYWCLGNKQIFNNTVNPVVFSNAPIVTSHYGLPNDGPELPLFVLGFAFVFYLLFSRAFQYLSRKVGLLGTDEPMELDENLGSYFECVDPWNSKVWYAKTLYCEKQLGMKTMSEWELSMLATSKTHKKSMKEPCNYEMMSNYKYQKLYQYTPIELRDTVEETAISDSLERLLNLGFFADELELDFLRENVSLRRKTEMRKERLSKLDDDEMQPLTKQ